MRAEINELLRNYGHNVNSIRLPLQLLDIKNISRELALEGTGLTLDYLDSFDNIVGVEQELAVYANLQALTEDPLLGLKIGDLYHNSAFGLFGYVVLHSSTLKESILQAYRFLDLSYAYFNHELRIDHEHAIMVVKPAITTGSLTRLLIERELSCIQCIFSQAIQRQHWISAIEISHGEEQFISAYKQHFSCPVSISSEYKESRVYFPVELLETPLPFYRSDLLEYFTEKCEMLLKEKAEKNNDLLRKIQQLLVSKPGYMPGIEQVADQLGLSSRTLRRRLSAYGISYRELLKETRLRLAKEYLRSSDLTVEQVAQLLGYSEPSNFSNAFKNWCGVGPRTYKQQVVDL